MKFLRPIAGFVGILREISLDEIRHQAEAPFSIGVTGPSAAECDYLISCFGGSPRDALSSGRPFRRLNWPVTGEEQKHAVDVDLIVFVASAEEEVPEGELEALRDTARGLTPLLVVRHGGSPAEIALTKGKGPAGVFRRSVLLGPLEPDQIVAQVVPAVIELLPDLTLSIGRRLSPFRAAAADKTIMDTGVANAEFALLSSLPALIPVLGNLVAASADFIVLTKNQIMMLMKLAAIHGRDLRQMRSIYYEIAPVVGAALVWRTVARELVALVPGEIGAVPKVVIAFAGTCVVGQMAAYYYDRGRRPPEETVRLFYARAAGQANEVIARLKDGLKHLREKPVGNGRALLP